MLPTRWRFSRSRGGEYAVDFRPKAKIEITGPPSRLNAGRVWTQFPGTLVTIVWSGAATFGILMALKYTIGLRVAKEIEIEGLDLRLHGEIIHF